MTKTSNINKALERTISILVIIVWTLLASVSYVIGDLWLKNHLLSHLLLWFAGTLNLGYVLSWYYKATNKRTDTNGDASSILINNNLSVPTIARMIHNGSVSTVDFSPDGKYVVSGSDDGTARVWEAASGVEGARVNHADGVWPVAFSPDGIYVISGCDETARVWEAASGVEVARITHDDIVRSVAFSPDGEYVVSGSWDGTARVWEAASGVEGARMTHQGYVWSAIFSPNGKYVVSGSDDGTARV